MHTAGMKKRNSQGRRPNMGRREASFSKKASRKKKKKLMTKNMTSRI
tara:strand:+ start:819 stop:959 length:141 start_codon:yes stop_codon:yes gene_type:complete